MTDLDIEIAPTCLCNKRQARGSSSRERIRDVKADQRQRNRYLGGTVPYGWRLNAGELVPDVDQQRIIRRVQELRGQGHSLRAIATMLASDGVQLSHMGVKAIVERAA